MDLRSGRSGNRAGQPGSSSSTSWVPGPAVITRTSDSTGPAPVATVQVPPDLVMPGSIACSITRTLRARSAACRNDVTAATPTSPAPIRPMTPPPMIVRRTSSNRLP
ncbi:MAG TPA: hypothetical protein VMC83_03835 [Streptosporangiaceae bacterium]|nr:hypothetical protein [Streptosporangiaceae bacterium]